MRTVALITLLVPVAALAQSTFSLAAAGYRLPSNAITAAPGQVVMISVRGLRATLATPATPIPGPDGFPTEVGGVSVDFVQGSSTIRLRIRTMQQTPCAGAAPCSPAIAMLTQIPYELAPGSRAVLRVREAGAVAGEIAVRGVTDSIHVLDSCDETLVFYSAVSAAGVPAGACVPMVLNYSSPALVTPSNPAREGNTLGLYAYGLGAVDRDPSGREGLPLAVQPFTLNFHFAGSEKMPERRIVGVAPAAVAQAGAGQYQVNFVMPPVPAGLPACEGPEGYNLTILLTGPQSSGVARVCAGR